MDVMLSPAGFIGLATLIATAAHADSPEAIRLFHTSVPTAAVADLKKRIASTRWPEREVVEDRSQGAQLARVQALAAYWANGYDWRRAEARLNALPQFVTTIDGVDIHFIHVRSRHRNEHRVLEGIGHNVPQEAPAAFAQAIVDIDGFSR
jgi:pimeloyl-ACP methyl ester carboxylesterase